jgi:hypothetical protein
LDADGDRDHQQHEHQLEQRETSAEMAGATNFNAGGSHESSA